MIRDVHPGSRIQGWIKKAPDPGSRIRIRNTCFHHIRLESGEDDSSSEAHLQSSKTSRGSYSDPKLDNFVKIFELHPGPPGSEQHRIPYPQHWCFPVI